MDANFLDTIQAAFRDGDANASSKLEEAHNVRLVEQMYQALAHGDFSTLDDILTDDVVLEIIGPANVPFCGRSQGRKNVVEVTRNNFAELENQRPEILSLVAQGDTVVVVGREHGCFRATRREYELHWMHQYTFRAGKLSHIRELLDSASLLEAATPQ